MKHKWDKSIYSGKYSSFEFKAICVKCGCERKKLTYGYDYVLDGKRTEKSPNCDERLINQTTNK